MARPYQLTSEIATTLAQICCMNNQLPHGAPTSPIISNMICARLDSDLIRLAIANNCFYTRYSDDITFSIKSVPFPDCIVYKNAKEEINIGEDLLNVINSNSFVINESKTRLFKNNQRQMVTGLVTNNKDPNVIRNYVRQIRAMQHAWKKFGYELAEKEYIVKYNKKRNNNISFKSVLKGKLAYLKMIKGINNDVYRNLQSKMLILDPDYIKIIKKEISQMETRDFFICHASEDKDDFVEILARKMIEGNLTCFYDSYDLSPGDSITTKIQDGLKYCNFGLIIISKNFINKTFAKQELNYFLKKQDSKNSKIIPIWYKVELEVVENEYPLLSDIYAIKHPESNIDEIVLMLKKKLASISKSKIDKSIK